MAGLRLSFNISVDVELRSTNDEPIDSTVSLLIASAVRAKASRGHEFGVER